VGTPSKTMGSFGIVFLFLDIGSHNYMYMKVSRHSGRSHGEARWVGDNVWTLNFDLLAVEIFDNLENISILRRSLVSILV
jgi:hypothetical protein